MYPLYLIDKQIKSFLNNQFSNNDTFKDNLKKIIFLTTNLALRKRLANCVKYFAEPRTSISFHLYLKEALCSRPLPNALKSFVVYKFTCAGC